MLEVRQKISLLINNVLLEDNDRDWHTENDILNHLLNLICIENKPSRNVKIELSNESSIDRKFEEKIRYSRRTSALFL